MKPIILFCLMYLAVLQPKAQDTLITIKTVDLSRLRLKKIDELTELHAQCNRQIDSLQSEYKEVTRLLYQLNRNDSMVTEALKRFRFSIDPVPNERTTENLRGVMVFDSMNQKNWFFELTKNEQDSLLFMYIQARNEADYTRQMSAISRGKCFYLIREISNDLTKACSTRWNIGEQILRVLEQNENLMPCVILFDDIILPNGKEFILLN